MDNVQNSSSHTPAKSPSTVEGFPTSALTHVTARTEELLHTVSFPLETVDALKARETRTHALHHIADYVRPRLVNHNAPMLVVVGGSTGSGKSTLINSLLSERVTLPGALRPTTRNPVLIHNLADAHWFAGDRILPSLAREHSTLEGGATVKSDEQHSGHRELRIVESDSVPQGIALIDSPDVDSMVDANRELAHQLLAAADLWLFVTTAARYADAVPWETLRQAVARDTEVAIVIDRVDPQAMDVVLDLRHMLDSQGLNESPLFVIEEQHLQDGLIPAQATAHIAQWLTWIALSPTERDRVVAATRNGAVESLARTVEELAVHVETQLRARDNLLDIADTAYSRAFDKVREATSDGSLLRGEVLRRWQDYVGTGELMRGVEEKISALRDRVSAYVRGKAAAPKVQQAVGDTLYAVVKDTCDRAAESVYRDWFANPAGKPFVADTSLATSSKNLAERLAYEIRAWQGSVLELVSESGSQKRSKARALAFGTNGLGVALMIVAFASTGGLTGIEAGIAGGTGVAAQKLLESVFGEDAVRKLARDAQVDLERRMLAVINEEKERYAQPLNSLGLQDNQSSELRTTARQLHAGAAALSARTVEPHDGPKDAGPTGTADSAGTAAPTDPSGTIIPTALGDSDPGKWFGGSVDGAASAQLSPHTYEGAILYGTAGISGAPANPSSPPPPPKPEEKTGTWWKKLFGGSQGGTEK